MRKPLNLRRKALALAAPAVLLALSAGPALAHHGMHGDQPSTPAEGFAAGLAHPVLGLDHFAILIGVGLLAARFQRGLGLPFVFIIAMAAGCGLHFARVDLPLLEIWVALSVFAVGLTAALRPTAPLPLTLGLFGISGLLHGYALAETMVGAQTGAVWAYLAGLVLIQGFVATAVLVAARWLAARHAVFTRLVGGLVAAAGAAFVVMALSA